VPGDLVGVTQPGSSGLLVRRGEPLAPGAGIRLTNSANAPTTVSIDVAYPGTTAHLEVVVAAKAERVVHLELPPYWAGELPAGGKLPACAQPDPWPVSVKLSAPGTPAMTVSSCAYLQAVAVTTSGSAVTYGAGGGTPTPTPATVPAGTPGIGLAAPLAVVVLVMFGIGFVILRRRRTTPS